MRTTILSKYQPVLIICQKLYTPSFYNYLLPTRKDECYYRINIDATALFAVHSAKLQLCYWDFENLLVIWYRYDILTSKEADL